MTITDVEITYDISIAKIFYSVYPWSENNLKEADTGLQSAKKFIRMQLGKSLHVIESRTTFKLDTSLDHGDRINELITRDLVNKSSIILPFKRMSLNGIIFINKKAGISSAGVVRR